MKTRNHRLLEVLAIYPEGCTLAEITSGIDSSEPRHRNATALTWLKESGLVARKPGRLWVITPAGKKALKALEAGGELNDVGARAPAGELSDAPIVLRTQAVDGQAPRHLANSPFTLARSFTEVSPPPRALARRAARSGEPQRHSRKEGAVVDVTAKPATSVAMRQVGGDHYERAAIQPWDYIAANGLGFFEGNVIKYVSRWKNKDGLKDLKKAQHYLNKLIALEEGKSDD